MCTALCRPAGDPQRETVGNRFGQPSPALGKTVNDQAAKGYRYFQPKRNSFWCDRSRIVALV
jgi:hypothetical protein